ncbi:wax ester/triacylglycerol synthase domain-containing protein [Streptomyces bobili]|uniref:wax ester/triacylglycerol synthase domain-containing protein n=1 Tax=Streptomyces bobili TaxID=67280 RepID=UPI00366A0D14
MAQTHPPTSQTMGVVLHLEGTPPAAGEFRSHLTRHLDLEPRLTHYLHGPGLTARWQYDPAPDLQERVQERRIPTGDAHLHAALRDLMAQPLPDQGPRWDAWLLSGYAPDRYAICWRAHHSTQDGMGLISTLHTLFGGATPPAVRAVARPTPGAYLRTLRGTLSACAANNVWNDPARPLDGTRAVNWAHLPTQRLRGPATQRGGDTNDAFLAVLSGALRTWSADHWPRGVGRRLPALTMVNLRRAEENQRPGNLITFAPVALPCDDPSADNRLGRVIEATRSTKDAARLGAMRSLMDLTPNRVFHRAATLLTTPDRAAITTSYVAIHRPLHYGRHPVTHVQPFNWLPRNQPASIVACSYNDTTSVCFVTDAALPGLHSLAELFSDAAEELAPTRSGQPQPPTRPGGPEARRTPPAEVSEDTSAVVDFAFIKDLLVHHAALPAAPIVQDATRTQAGIDSMAVTALSMALEDQLGLVVTEEDLAQAPTVTDMVDLVARRAAPQPG